MEERQIWKHFNKLSSEATFDSPDSMWKAAKEYFEWCDSNPMYRSEQLKKPGQPIQLPDGRVVPGETLVELPIKRPYTKKGLCIFLGVNQSYFRTFEDKHRKNPVAAERTKEWLQCIDLIYDVIENQQFEGATSGFFNAMIISRQLGLADKSEVDTKVTSVKEVFKIGDKEFEL
jgi:hypothetical protein